MAVPTVEWGRPDRTHDSGRKSPRPPDGEEPTKGVYGGPSRPGPWVFGTAPEVYVPPRMDGQTEPTQ